METVDVAIVGYGPVGQLLAALLGKAGHRVAVFERFEEIYRQPRAAHLDHEAMRILQSAGVADGLVGEFLPIDDYHWYGADGEPLMTFRAPVPAASGWDSDYLFFQPTLERALDARARSFERVSVDRGWAAEAVEPDADGVTLWVRRASGSRSGELRSVRARWLIGADGANSFVREAAGIGRRDLGFEERWLVVDVEPRDMRAIDLPPACQWCDPARPTTHVQSGRHHRRWEFMLLPGEEPGDLERRAWELLAPWFRPSDGDLIRSVVYEFRSMLAERMRDGRMLVAGDAAHLTPPFLGQGLCAGMRDAANLAWKLDLVLRDRAADGLLDTVELERQPQNEGVIRTAMELGRALCELDPARASERDTAIRAAAPPGALALPPLGEGVVRRDDPLAGRISVQGRVALDGREGLLDDLTGGGFTLLTRDGAGQLAEVTTVALNDATDLDGRMSAWLDGHGVVAALVRPDFYVFGSAATPDDVPALLDDLHDQLSPALTTT